MPQEQIRKRKKGKKRFLSAVIGITLLALLGLGLSLYVTPKEGYRRIELGEVISSAPEMYLNGSTNAVKLAEVDLSGVDKKTPGTYQIKVKYLFKTFPFQITIEDTISPILSLKEGELCIAAKRAYNPSYFVDSLTDNSENVSLTFDGNVDTIQFEEVGGNDLNITARDASDNETTKMIHVRVENAPILTGIKDYYITPDAAPNYMQSVVANDIEDGELTKAVFIDSSAVNTEYDGTYPITYEVSDSDGVTTEQTANVTVCSPEELEQRVGNRSVDVLANRIVGIPNFRDMGAAELPNIGAQEDYVTPALVYFKIITPNLKGNGSGFIINMTEDYVDICSNEHVLRYGQEHYQAVFSGGTSVSPVEVLGLDEEKDIGFARVKREDIPTETLDTLMSVHINETDWNNMTDDNRELFMVCIGENGDPNRTKSGKLIKRDASAAPYHEPSVTEFTISVIHGNSGSPVFDAYGNLNSMAFAYMVQSDGVSRRFGIRLCDILEDYEQITGNTLYTY